MMIMSDMKFMGLPAAEWGGEYDEIRRTSRPDEPVYFTVSAERPLIELIEVIRRVRATYSPAGFILKLTPARIAEINEAFTLVAPVKPVSWTIKLTYFKPSGKYYTHGEYRTNKANMFEIADEVEHMNTHGALPGLTSGCEGYFHIHIDAGDHPNAYPVLVPSREVTR
jgi:hypothetical protein